MEYENQLIKNPYTNKIPERIKELEAKFAEKIKIRNIETEASKKSSETSSKSKYRRWQNRGPGNVGGRTRALALDRENENTIFAGGVSGGLWRSADLGQSWGKITIKSIAQHNGNRAGSKRTPKQYLVLCIR